MMFPWVNTCKYSLFGFLEIQCFEILDLAVQLLDVFLDVRLQLCNFTLIH